MVRNQVAGMAMALSAVGYLSLGIVMLLGRSGYGGEQSAVVAHVAGPRSIAQSVLVRLPIPLWSALTLAHLAAHPSRSWYRSRTRN